MVAWCVDLNEAQAHLASFDDRDPCDCEKRFTEHVINWRASQPALIARRPGFEPPPPPPPKEQSGLTPTIGTSDGEQDRGAFTEEVPITRGSSRQMVALRVPWLDEIAHADQRCTRPERLAV